jgi:hypothetical protein
VPTKTKARIVIVFEDEEVSDMDLDCPERIKDFLAVAAKAGILARIRDQRSARCSAARPLQ